MAGPHPPMAVGPMGPQHPLAVAQALLAQQLTQLLALQDQERQLPWAAVQPPVHTTEEGHTVAHQLAMAGASTEHMQQQVMRRTCGIHHPRLPLHVRAQAPTASSQEHQHQQSSTAQPQHRWAHQRQHCQTCTWESQCQLSMPGSSQQLSQQQSGLQHRLLQQGQQMMGWPREWCQRHTLHHSQGAAAVAPWRRLCRVGRQLQR